jgi:hypothetical protein
MKCTLLLILSATQKRETILFGSLILLPRCDTLFRFESRM